MYASPPRAGAYTSIIDQRDMPAFLQFVVLRARRAPDAPGRAELEPPARDQLPFPDVALPADVEATLARVRTLAGGGEKTLPPGFADAVYTALGAVRERYAARVLDAGVRHRARPIHL